MGVVPEQIGLFGDIGLVPALRLPVVVGEVLPEWSYSRRSLFEQCLRAYYYKYYGAKSGAAKSEPLKPQLRFLKSLSNRHLRAGILLHLVLRTYLKKLAEGDEWTSDQLRRWATEMYRRDLAFSKEFQRTGTSLSSDGRTVLLAEFYAGLPNADALWNESVERLCRALDNFRNHPTMEPFRRAAKQSGVLVEKSVRLKEPGFRLKGQIDFAYSESGRVTLVDWKIGESGGSEDSLQLLSYALVAMQEYNCTPNDIDLYVAYLGDGKVQQYTVSEYEVSRAKGRIRQDSQRMLAMDWYGREAITEAFTPCEQKRICDMCPFNSVCPGSSNR